MAFSAQNCAFFWSTSTGAVSTSTAGGAYIGQVVGFNGPSFSSPVIDITNLNSSAKEKLVGIYDAGQIQLDLLYQATVVGQVNMLADLAAGAIKNWCIALSDSSTSRMLGNGYITAFNIQAAVDDAVKASVTIEISGGVTSTKV